MKKLSKPFDELVKLPEGSKLLQAVLGVVDIGEQKDLAGKMQNKTIEYAKTPLAHWFLQECILQLPITAIGFIVTELKTDKTFQVVKHMHGTQVMQRLIEHGCNIQKGTGVYNDMTELLQHIVNHTEELACDNGYARRHG